MRGMARARQGQKRECLRRKASGQVLQKPKDQSTNKNKKNKTVRRLSGLASIDYLCFFELKANNIVFVIFKVYG